MKPVDQCFFLMLQKSITRTLKKSEKKSTIEFEASSEDWEEILHLAKEQDILGLIYEEASHCNSFRNASSETKKGYQQETLQTAIRQITQTNEFLTLLLRAQQQGLDPVVMKGVVLRSIYPMPMLRPSVDEDLLISANEKGKYHKFFLSQGLFADDPDAGDDAHEWSYHKENSPTYIELHTSLFPPESDAYGDLNRLFEGALERSVTVQIEDVTVRTLAPTDHLLFLLCHAYKHFLHSGVGIRQVCDIGMFIREYGKDIDWKHVREACERIHIAKFAAAIFRINERHLGFEMVVAFAEIEVDEIDLLEDILSGGSLGTADIDRMHSSTITLEAVSADKTGRKRGGAWHSVFLPAKSLEGRYPYLKKHKWMLPLAWGQRVVGYLGKRKEQKVDPTKSIRIGNERVKLLRKYGIIE